MRKSAKQMDDLLGEGEMRKAKEWIKGRTSITAVAVVLEAMLHVDGTSDHGQHLALAEELGVDWEDDDEEVNG